MERHDVPRRVLRRGESRHLERAYYLRVNTGGNVAFPLVINVTVFPLPTVTLTVPMTPGALLAINAPETVWAPAWTLNVWDSPLFNSFPPAFMKSFKFTGMT